jgi:hypothetical protein
VKVLTRKRRNRVGRTMLGIVRPTDRHSPRGGPHRDESRLDPPYASAIIVGADAQVRDDVETWNG